MADPTKGNDIDERKVRQDLLLDFGRTTHHPGRFRDGFVVPAEDAALELSD